MERNNNLLIVDDEIQIITSIKRFFRKDDYTIFSATSGQEGIEILKNKEVGVILSDLNMPGMDGLRFFENISKEHRDVCKILLTGKATMDSTLEAINRLSLFGYLKKPWPAEELKSTIAKAFDHYNLIVENKRLQKNTRVLNQELMRVNEMLEKRGSQLETALKDSIMMVASTAEIKDPDSKEHMKRVQGITTLLCTELGVEKELSEKIIFFSAVHDIGNSHVPDKILLKSDSLNDDEWDIIKQHTIVGEDILGDRQFYTSARSIIRSHHENWDGSGYPDGLKEEEISIAARIVTIADVYDSMTHDRPYRKAWSKSDAINEIRDMSGIKFDPDIVYAFLRIINGLE